MSYPVASHGKNAFLAIGYDKTSVTVPTATIASATSLTVTVPSGSLLSSSNPVVSGISTYGMFVNGEPTVTATAPSQGSSGTITLVKALASGAASGSGLLLPMVNLSPWSKDFSLPEEIETSDTTTFSHPGVKTAIVGLKGWNIPFSGQWDGTAASGTSPGGIDAILTSAIAFQDLGTPVSFVYGPATDGLFGGASSSNIFYYGQAWVSKYSLKSSVNGVVEFDSELMVTGPVTRIVL
jgi:hypothetical protein